MKADDTLTRNVPLGSSSSGSTTSSGGSDGRDDPVSGGGGGSTPSFDPLFSRFVAEHDEDDGLFERALREVARDGRKKSCWMWYFLPTPPWVGADGQEKGSAQNRRYCIRTTGEARAFLAFKVGSAASSSSWGGNSQRGGVHLGRRYKLLVEV